MVPFSRNIYNYFGRRIQCRVLTVRFDNYKKYEHLHKIYMEKFFIRLVTGDITCQKLK